MDAYDLKKLEELLRDFYNLTKIKICVYDHSENELCFYPEKRSSFCSLLRQDEEMDKRCKACDHHAFSECRKTREQYVYTCHAGLVECVSPILHGEKLIGYIAIGQIKTDTNTDFSLVKDNLPEALLPSLQDKFENLPTVDMDKIHSAIRILDACTGYEYLKRLAASSENKIDALLDEYINEHLTENLSAPVLCSVFHLSHSELYSVFKNYFLSTPAEYVKMRRLKHACHLLKTTSLPINTIAGRCGISDYKYFSKIFKRAFGRSPREFRKNAALRP